MQNTERLLGKWGSFREDGKMLWRSRHTHVVSEGNCLKIVPCMGVSYMIVTCLVSRVRTGGGCVSVDRPRLV